MSSSLRGLNHAARDTFSGGKVTSPLYAGVSLGRGGFWNSLEGSGAHTVVNAGSVFVGIDTFMGSIFLGYGHAEGGINSFYLTFGPLLRTEANY